jgi:hypothetical protein
MRKSRAIQKRKNNVPVQRRKLLQKVAPRLSDQPDVSIDTANTNSKTANTFQLSREADWRGPTDRKAPTAISVGSDSDLCLTPALPVREVQQSQSAFLESEFGSIEKWAELDLPATPFAREVHKFDRWMFEASVWIIPQRSKIWPPTLSYSICFTSGWRSPDAVLEPSNMAISKAYWSRKTQVLYFHAVQNSSSSKLQTSVRMYAQIGSGGASYYQ